jgi:hypothetical protein
LLFLKKSCKVKDKNQIFGQNQWASREKVVMQFTSDCHFQKWLKKGRILAYEGTDGHRRIIMITSLDEVTIAGSGKGGGLLEPFKRAGSIHWAKDHLLQVQSN